MLHSISSSLIVLGNHDMSLHWNPSVTSAKAVKLSRDGDIRFSIGQVFNDEYVMPMSRALESPFQGGIVSFSDWHSTSHYVPDDVAIQRINAILELEESAAENARQAICGKLGTRFEEFPQRWEDAKGMIGLGAVLSKNTVALLGAIGLPDLAIAMIGNFICVEDDTMKVLAVMGHTRRTYRHCLERAKDWILLGHIKRHNKNHHRYDDPRCDLPWTGICGPCDDDEQPLDNLLSVHDVMVALSIKCLLDIQSSNKEDKVKKRWWDETAKLLG